MTSDDMPAADGLEDGVANLMALSDDVTSTVSRWLKESAEPSSDAAARRLTAILSSPYGPRFAMRFIDSVVRPEDATVAAQSLASLARDMPPFLPIHQRAALWAGAKAGRVAPSLVVPVVRRVVRSMVGHLVVDARAAKLGRAITRIRNAGMRLNVNLLGEAVLGKREAARRLEGVIRLLDRPDVDYVSLKVSSVVAPHSPWAFDEAVVDVVESLTALFRRATASSPPTFINLDMEEYRDLELTLAVFTTLLDQPEFLHLEAGIVLQAYLPDTLGAMMRLQEWSAARRARGGAPIKVRLVKGANLPMERVDAELHGWPLATWDTKQATDTNYKRLLDYALNAERVKNVRVGVAGHNLFDIAFAWLLAGQRKVRDSVEFEMLLGMAPAQAEAVRRDVGDVRLYTPVVHPREFDVAVTYLVRRLEEGSADENFMSALSRLHDNPELFKREKDRFLASLAALDRTTPVPKRKQDRNVPLGAELMEDFTNVSDTDSALPPNLAWGRAILKRAARSTIGNDLVRAATVRSSTQLDELIGSTVTASGRWAALPGAQRATYLRRVAVALEQQRADLLEVMAAEAGKTLDQSDPEVSEAIDFANYYATLAEELDHIDGAVARPVGLTVVTPPWNFPVAIPAGSTLAALAAGSAVVIKPASQTRRCGSVLVEALWAAGIPRDVLRVVHIDELELGRQLVSDPRVGRLILTGAYETAETFRSFRPDLPLLAETSGKNAIVVTPSADVDLAVKDIVASAFGHAGQKCSAASLAILVGSVATSRRFRDQLVDAVTSLRVGLPTDPKTQMGPLVEPATGKLLEALTTLGSGESWMVRPRQLDHDGRLWSPGVKTGVRPGSECHLTEYFGPILGIMSADSLNEAIRLQNQVAYGLTAGLHSLDRNDVAFWLDHVQAGNLYVNRGITGAIVRRQPFGGWKKSAVGAGTKAGGPNYLIGLCDWTPAPSTSTTDISAGPAALFAAACDAGLELVDFLERALRSDAAAWAHEFGIVRGLTDLAAERNLFRYRPHPVIVRHSSGSPVTHLLRVVAAGMLAGAEVTVSTHVDPPPTIRSVLEAHGVTVTTEDDQVWWDRAGHLTNARVRMLGGSAPDLCRAVNGRPDVAVYAQPVTESGRIELLPFLREQAISVTAHRFGTPHALLGDRRVDELSP